MIRARIVISEWEEIDGEMMPTGRHAAGQADMLHGFDLLEAQICISAMLERAKERMGKGNGG